MLLQDIPTQGSRARTAIRVAAVLTRHGPRGAFTPAEAPGLTQGMRCPCEVGMLPAGWHATRVPFTFTMGTYSSGGAGWILLDISMTAFTRPVTFSYTLSLERSRLAVGGGLMSWG